MIVQVIHKEEMKSFILEGREKELVLGNQYVTLVKLKDEWHLSSYAGFLIIYYERIAHGSRLILEDSFHELYILRFSMYSVDYDHFKAYEKRNLLIGPSIECDVYVQDKLCPLVNLDIASMKLHLLKEEEVYLNGKQYKDEVLKNGDEVIINNLRIGIAPDCLLINQCKNILIGMKEIRRVSELQPAYPKKELVHRGFETRRDVDPLVLRLPSMELLPMHNSNMVNLSAILMAFATLSTALMNSYRQYDSGRALLDYLPYLIMPMIMFISSVILVPLTRWLEMKKHKKEQLELQHRFDDYMEELFEECEGYKNRYLFNNNSDKNVFEQYVASKEVYSRSLPFVFHLGKGMIDIPIVVENAGKDQKALFDKYRQAESWIKVSMETIKTLSIQEDKDYLYQHILLELVTQYPPESYYVVFVGEQQDLEARSELWYIQSSYYKDKHLCAWNQESLQVIEALVSSVQVPVVFIFFKKGLLPKEKKERYFYIHFCEECFHDSEGMIELRGEQGIFKTRQQVYSFNILPHTFDLVAVLQRIFEMKDKVLPTYHQELTQESVLQAYKRNRAYEGLKVVIGLDEEGNEVTIDLSEKGQGPHCLLAGTTGSGKSLFLMNWILQLALKYAYEQVQFALIDFKGGGLVTAFDNPHFSLPHLRGSLSNLDLNETERVLIALKKECQLRESLFIKMQQMSNRSEMNIDIYLEMNEKYHYLPELAHLIVIVDEFAELKASYPESMDELISLSRIGRSLGIHLILCTQKPSGVVNEQIWSNARLKLCLKVGSKSDSQEMIESADAFGLRNPGEFYGYYDNQRFYGKAFYPFEAWNKEESQRIIVEKDLQLNVVHQRVFDEGGFNYFQKAISCIPKGFTKEPLWLKPLEKVHSELPCVGIMDDIEELRQIPWCMHEENHVLILYDDAKELERVLDLINAEIGGSCGKVVYVGNHCYEGDYVQNLSYEKEDLYALLRTIEQESIRIVIERFTPINSFLIQEGIEWSSLMNKGKFVFCFHVSERIPSSLLNGCKTKLSLVKDKSVIMDCLMVALSKIKESKHPLLFKDNHCYALGLCDEVGWEIINNEVVELAALEDQILPEEGLIGKNVYSLAKVYFKSDHPHVVGERKSLDLFKRTFELANQDTSIDIHYETQRSYPSEEVVELGCEKEYQGVYTYQGKREVIQLVGFHRHHS